MFYTNTCSPVKESATIEIVDRVRVDKWLWAARFAKTRSAATDLVLAGHVKVGGERVKPAREVTPGDTLEIRLGTVRRVVVEPHIARHVIADHLHKINHFEGAAEFEPDDVRAVTPHAPPLIS